MESKSFKDPAYGYVEIPTYLVSSVIDTQEFQRLRRIVQTSYEPLYPSATHNRFVHSLGVYHLGSIVAETIKRDSLPSLGRVMGGNSKVYCRYLEVFCLACLLHDVGHAPFSHTGEGFYITIEENGRAVKLHDRIAHLLKDESFSKECEKRGELAAAHELMSVVVALVAFKKLFKSNAEMAFFARAITGYLLPLGSRNADHVENSFLNCLIQLLHSQTIDVDRLDYLIRDAFATGFKTVSVDYQRLLGGVRIREDGGVCRLVFTKRAVSVLENVIYAHDAEKKWVQKHPAINYEMKLLSRAFTSVNARFAQKLKGKTIFCETALMGRGVSLPDCGELCLRYLCDDDLIFLMKNIDDVSAKRYLNRSMRYQPLWKSEAEFCALFGKEEWVEKGQDLLSPLKMVFEALLSFLNKNSVDEINRETLNKLKQEAEQAKNGVVVGGRAAKFYLDDAIVCRQKELLCELVKVLQTFAKRHSVPFKFQILDGKVFTSGFATDKLPKLLIELGAKGSTVEFGKITNVLGSRKGNLPDKVYYLFGEKWTEDKYLLASELVSDMKDFISANSDEINLAFYSAKRT